ncbi:MAG: WhiB family transcriptional regulator [Pseudonocardiaceae bacterium]
MSVTKNETARWWEMTTAELSRVEIACETNGLCAMQGADADTWTPAEQTGGPKTESGREKSLERAKAACEGCPMLADCRRAALNRPDKDGIFGGMPGWALEEIRRTRPLERVVNRDRYDSMVILGERSRQGETTVKAVEGDECWDEAA